MKLIMNPIKQFYKDNEETRYEIGYDMNSIMI